MSEEIHFSLFNFGHGGANCSGRTGLQTSWNLQAMVEVLASGTRWPDHLTLCEAEQWYRNGGELMFTTAFLMRKASGGRPYVPFLGTLTHDRGPIAPCVIVDLSRLVIRGWHDGNAPDFYGDARNRMIVHLPRDEHDTSRWIRTRAIHFCPWSSSRKLEDAQALRNEGNPVMPNIVLGDTNQPLSGPGWELTDLGDPQRLLWHTAPRRDFLHQRATGEVRQDTAAMDYLCGWWNPELQQRVGGAGLFAAAELVGDQTPTKPTQPNGRQATVTSNVLVNSRWRNNIVHYKVVDANGHSDHNLVEVSVRH